MKFSYRMIALSILSATIIVVYFSWGSDVIFRHMNNTKSKIVSSFSQSGNSDENFPSGSSEDVFKVNQNSPGVIDPDVCSFGFNGKASSDIDTFDILGEMNEELLAGRNGLAKPTELKDARSTSEEPMTVILVPHSHSDPGWLKTIEHYFDDQTRPTLDNMVEKLMKYPNMTFIWAESVFLSLWWDTVGDQKKAQVKELLSRGQLEIVIGSWVVPDEATTHYAALVDQMIEGHHWLKTALDYTPRTTWSLDPFGYSSTLPYLYRRAGFDNMVILRVHEDLKERLQNQKALEFFWAQEWDEKHTQDIFTQMMPYMLYNIKHTCGPDTSVCLQFDFRKIPGEYGESRAQPVTSSNVGHLSHLLHQQYRKKASLFRHKVLLVPLGDDFRYDRNIEWDQQYTNYIKLFDYMNQKKEWNVNARFGTLQDYFMELKKHVKSTNADVHELFPTLQGDMFPYTDHDGQFWTGYFTSRPFDKMFGREIEVYLRVAEILSTLAGAMSMNRQVDFKYFNEKCQNKLTVARRELGLFQHHDAITGTSLPHVANDNEERLNLALKSTREVMAHSTNFIMGGLQNKTALKPELPKGLKMLNPASNLIEVEKVGTQIVLFNSIAQNREELIRLTVNCDTVKVVDRKGQVVTNQINPMWNVADVNRDMFELTFLAKISPLTLLTYTLYDARDTPLESHQSYAAHIRMFNIQDYQLPPRSRFSILPPPMGLDSIIIDNEHYRVWCSARSGLMESVVLKTRFKTIKAKMSLLMYKSRGSGAYIFDPAGPAVDSEFMPNPPVRVIRGPITTEVHVLHTIIEHNLVIVNSSGELGAAIEINNIVDLHSMDNKEIIMKINSDIENKDKTFYTDSNGFKTVKRRRFKGFRTQANYYPMTSHAYLEDSTARLSILSAQSLGVSSQDDGSLEVMLDRRPLYDDGKGLGQGIRDSKRTPSRFYLMLEKAVTVNKTKTFEEKDTLSHPSLLAQTLSNILRNYVTIFTSDSPLSLPLSKGYQFVEHALPCDVRLLNLRNMGHFHSPTGTRGNTTLTSVNAGVLLHRVGFQCGFFSPPMACTSPGGHIHLHSTFHGFNVAQVEERSLSFMHDKGDVKTDQSVALTPMNIYAFNVTFHPKLNH